MTNTALPLREANLVFGEGNVNCHVMFIGEAPGANEVHLYHSPGHQREFLDSVKSRRPPLAPAETAHRAASIGHLGQIAMILGRKIAWDPESETIANDPAAAHMLSTPMRAPWHI